MLSTSVFGQNGFENTLLRLIGDKFIEINEMYNLVNCYDGYQPVETDTILITYSDSISEVDKEKIEKFSGWELLQIKALVNFFNGQDPFKSYPTNRIMILDTIGFFGCNYSYKSKKYEISVTNELNENLVFPSLMRLIAIGMDKSDFVLSFVFDKFAPNSDKFDFWLNVHVSCEKGLGKPKYKVLFHPHIVSQHLINMWKNE